MSGISGTVGNGGRNDHADVVFIQNRLNSHRSVIAPQPTLVVDGKSGQKTVSAIKRFQSIVCGFASPDGRVDPGRKTETQLKSGFVVATQDGLAGPGSTISADSSAAEITAAEGAVAYDYRAGPQEKLADIAAYYVGARETGANRHGGDPRMMEIFAADDNASPGDGYAWCCALVTLCTQKLIAQKSNIYRHIRAPHTAHCFTFRDTWAVSNNCRVIGPNDFNAQPHKGDVIVYPWSHIGIIESVSNSGIVAIEGNTTNEAKSREGHSCLRKTRSWGSISNTKIIRYPVPAQQEAEPVDPSSLYGRSPYDWMPHYNTSTPSGFL